MIMWTEPDCKGIPASTILDHTNFAKKYLEYMLISQFQAIPAPSGSGTVGYLNNPEAQPMAFQQ